MIGRDSREVTPSVACVLVIPSLPSISIYKVYIIFYPIFDALLSIYNPNSSLRNLQGPTP